MEKILCVPEVLLQVKTFLFVLFNASPESVNSFFFLKNLETHFYKRFAKKTSLNALNIYRNIYRKNLSAIIYRLPISLLKIEIYQLSISPWAFLKLSIIVIQWRR